VIECEQPRGEALREAMREVGPHTSTMLSTPSNIEKALTFADLVLGAAAPDPFFSLART